MAVQIGTTRRASQPRLMLRASPVDGAAWRCGIGGLNFALGEDLPSGGIAGMGGEDEGGRVAAAGSAM